MSNYVNVQEHGLFTINPASLEPYRDKEVPWGYGLLSYFTYKRTYARPLTDDPNGPLEEWWQTCARVINGCFTILRAHCLTHKLPWSEDKAQELALEMYDRLFELKWTPPGRGLWAMGTSMIYERGSASLQNCAFISTEHLDRDMGEVFEWAFLMSMNGVGVGFDTDGADLGLMVPDGFTTTEEVYIVEDTRESWAAAIGHHITNLSRGVIYRHYDVSRVRPKGSPIRTFGGVASGPEPLLNAIATLTEEWVKKAGQPLDSELIVDTFNIIAVAVVSGGVRRSAMIALGKRDDHKFLALKTDYDKFSQWRYTSNNSPRCEVGQDYTDICEYTKAFGEPGMVWMDNARAYGRMCEAPNYKDARAKGCNPCVEQTLESYELCNLNENYPARHHSLEDFKRTLKMSYLYSKIVTLVPTHSEKTNKVMMRNRRIGTSMSGIVQNIAKLGLAEHIRWCDESYKYLVELDTEYSEWLGIPRSIKLTSVKPSGTVSLLAGATPGIHDAEDRYYLRRVRVADSSTFWKRCQESGYPVEASHNEPNTMIVSFPMEETGLTRFKRDVSIWEQTSRAALHQAYWADNQVSCTVTFQPHEADDIARVLSHFDRQLKGISFLPFFDNNNPETKQKYPQAPYEPISKEHYDLLMSKIDQTIQINASWLDGQRHEAEDKFCDGEACAVRF